VRCSLDLPRACPPPPLDLRLACRRRPGWFIGRAEGGAGAALALVRATAARLNVSIVPPAAEYPPASFWAQGPQGRDVLLWPLNEMVDETYTVYWRLCAAAGGCAPRAGAGRGAWRTQRGFLIKGQELGSEEVTVAAARALCLADARCTSFCYNCGARDCAGAEDETVTVYFKTFAEPKENIQRHPTDHWHSHYLEVEEPKDCEGGKGGGEELHLSNYRQGNPFEQS
jgi:hypothetical protein